MRKIFRPIKAQVKHIDERFYHLEANGENFIMPIGVEQGLRIPYHFFDADGFLKLNIFINCMVISDENSIRVYPDHRFYG